MPAIHCGHILILLHSVPPVSSQNTILRSVVSRLLSCESKNTLWSASQILPGSPIARELVRVMPFCSVKKLTSAPGNPEGEVRAGRDRQGGVRGETSDHQ